MKTLIPVILSELSAGRTVGLATVLQAKGSAPRGAGACQLLLASGQSVGTVGGGALEARALQTLSALLHSASGVAPASPIVIQALPDGSLSCLPPADGESRTDVYTLTQDDAQSLGMVCGGGVTLLYQTLSPATKPFWEALLARGSQENEVWLARAIRNGQVISMALRSSASLPTSNSPTPSGGDGHGNSAIPSGSAAQANGGAQASSAAREEYIAQGRHAMQATTENLSTDNATEAANSQTGNTSPEKRLPPPGGRRAAWFTPDGSPNPDGAGELSWFVEPIWLSGRTYIFGGGHVAQRLAPLLAQLDFSPLVYDDRPEFANYSLFPEPVDVLCAPFDEAGQRLTVTGEDEIVIMTRGHVNDQLLLTQALRTPAYYLGLIGSRSKIAHTRALLLEEGFSPDDFARIHTPIGLPILAETPMEIAVSVAAEMIRCRADHLGRTR